MTFKTFSAAAIMAAGFAASAAPASAQYYPYPPPPGPPPGYYGPRDPYGPRPYPPPRPPRPWDDGRFEDDRYYRPRPQVYGNLCVTSRGNCRTQPLPNGAACSCFIPGFGPKRGNILARPGY